MCDPRVFHSSNKVFSRRKVINIYTFSFVAGDDSVKCPCIIASYSSGITFLCNKKKAKIGNSGFPTNNIFITSDCVTAKALKDLLPWLKDGRKKTLAHNYRETDNLENLTQISELFNQRSVARQMGSREDRYGSS